MPERQRLAAHYSAMYDGELLALAAGSDDLTDVAREVLEGELKNRGLEPERPQAGAAPRLEQRPVHPALNDFLNAGVTPGMEEVPLSSGSFPGIVPDSPAEEAAGQEAEFTWKTQLCECEEIAQARMLQIVLGRAGIESWVEGRHSMNGYLRILVPADQLEAAREVAARPIPQEVIDELRQEVPEYDLPTCPACHAPDPVLEDVEPTNQWLCEGCGHRWSDPPEDQASA